MGHWQRFDLISEEHVEGEEEQGHAHHHPTHRLSQTLQKTWVMSGAYAGVLVQALHPSDLTDNTHTHTHQLVLCIHLSNKNDKTAHFIYTYSIIKSAFDTRFIYCRDRPIFMADADI